MLKFKFYTADLTYLHKVDSKGCVSMDLSINAFKRPPNGEVQISRVNFLPSKLHEFFDTRQKLVIEIEFSSIVDKIFSSSIYLKSKDAENSYSGIEYPTSNRFKNDEERVAVLTYPANRL